MKILAAGMRLNSIMFAVLMLPSLVASGQTAAPYHWVQVASRAPFAPRDGAGALIFQNKMWLLGGWNPSDKTHFPRVCNNEVWASSDGAGWSLVSSRFTQIASFGFCGTVLENTFPNDVAFQSLAA